MKTAWKAVMILLAILLLAGCKAWDCGCPMSMAPYPTAEAVG